MNNCLFCKIAAGEIPSNKLYEDDELIAFHDIYPKAPVHFLIVPKKHIESLLVAGAEDEALLGRIMLLVPKLAREQGLGAGFKTLVHTGKADGQEVFHLHVHVMGQPQ